MNYKEQILFNIKLPFKYGSVYSYLLSMQCTVHAHFLTPTALVAFFLSCAPRGEAGTSPFEVLSSSRRAPSHSSLWSLSTLNAWPRFVYDTAGGTDGPTRGERKTHTHTELDSQKFHQAHVSMTRPTFKISEEKGQTRTACSLRQRQAKPIQAGIYTSPNLSEAASTLFLRLYSYRSQGEHIHSRAVPSTCFEVLLLRELQDSSQPEDGAKHNGPTRLRRKLLHNQHSVQVESLILEFKC